MKPDHDEARKWAEEMLRLDSVSPLGKTANTARCYLDAMAQLKAVRLALGGYKDSDLATTLNDDIRAFLDERKHNDK